MHISKLNLGTFFFAASLLLFVGCGGGNGAMEVVTGTVTYEDGTPVAGGTIVFADMNKNSSSVGYLQEDGTYTLGTFGETDGAPQGKYKVTIIGSSDYGQSSPIRSDYSSQDRTPLTAEVVDGKNEINFQVEKGR